MTTIAAAMRALADAFEARYRTPEAGGARFYVLKDGSPQWMSDACCACHQEGAMLPDDVRYAMIRHIADSLADALDRDADYDLDEAKFDAADSYVPIYNHERAAWLASRMDRADYVDEARREGLIAADASLWDQLAIGIYTEAKEVADALLAALRSHADGEA